ncbi:MAG: hypothetical protein QOD02_4518 [Mycobacterium sp.]|nr:hypothetical protein [Mycobacterium sp.]MDT5171177.1 hypothetical protein [Mycobacterium sp.]MDT5198953.1 hypothetical protein [Mycobacterium sp.]MDT5307363.1 hypothetical protein [Mycobacterium sp.]MDT5340891.1 hypothetical protein [Mycobacterium sp.]
MERAPADAINGCAIEDRQQALARCSGLGVNGPFAEGCAGFVDAAQVLLNEVGVAGEVLVEGAFGDVCLLR